MTLIQKLKKLVLEGPDNEDGDLNLYALCEVANWPQIDDGEGDTEPLDLENHEMISLSNEKCVIWGGGDWQSPYKVHIILLNGELTVSHFEIDENGYRNNSFISEDEILTILRNEPEEGNSVKIADEPPGTKRFTGVVLEATVQLRTATVRAVDAMEASDLMKKGSPSVTYGPPFEQSVADRSMHRGPTETPLQPELEKILAEE